MVRYITENVVNINSRLDMWAQIRSETLDRCYNIPGYAEKSTEEKNGIYDRIKAEVEAEYLN